MKNELLELTKDFFEKLNIKIDSLELSINEDIENTFNIKIKTEESGLLIGTHGKTLDSIQNILKLFFSKRVGERVKLSIEVNDYNKTKDERLFDFIESKIKYLKNSNSDIILPYYSSYERKKIHFFVSKLEKDGITTKSIGEGKDRRIHLIKKEKTYKLTIDIDGDDI